MDKGLLNAIKLAAAIEKRLVVEITEDALCQWLDRFRARHDAATGALTRWAPGDVVDG